MKIPKVRDYPKNLEIRGNIWSVKFTKQLSIAHAGDCNPNKKLIRIRIGKHQDLHTIMRTFIHEVLHAIEFEYGFEMEHKSIEKLEEPLTDFILNNFD